MRLCNAVTDFEVNLQTPVATNEGFCHNQFSSSVGNPGQEPVEDQHVAAAGRHHASLRGHRPTDALLWTEDAAARAGGED